MEEFKDIRFYIRPGEAWDAMLNDCRKARKSIDIEQYIFYYDGLGKEFTDIFIGKAREGLRVRVLCDMVGGIGLYMSKAIQEMKDAGVQLIFFNPVRIWRINNFTSWYLRDHRKFLIVDSEIGYTGGIGVNEKMHDWRDTEVRIEGAAVRAMEYVFGRMWENAKAGRFSPFRRDLFTVGKTEVMTNSPHWRQRFVYWKMVEAIRSAERYIYITTPYFLPDKRLQRVIKLAVNRGIDVKIIVPAASDVRVVNVASHTYLKSLSRAGVKFYLYGDSILHAKTMAVDGNWATVGSTNMDGLSFSFNYEANIATSDKKFITGIEEDFRKDMASSIELTESDLRSRPLMSKIVGKLIRPFHKFL